MRRTHLEAFEPTCVLCATKGQQSHLRITWIGREQEGQIIEGMLGCPRGGCQREYPIFDGVPILVTNLQACIGPNILHFLERQDLSPELEGVIGDCTGPSSDYDVLRQRRGHYLLSHWIEPTSFLGLLQAGQRLVKPRGLAVDLGCSVGRGTFEAAGAGAELVLGIDLDFSMLRKASGFLRSGRQRLHRRRIGLVYDSVEMEGPQPHAERVDFWLADAMALPLGRERADTVSSYNLLDCLPIPRAHIASIGALLRPQGEAVVGCPYDWTVNVPLEGWIGGHSQRAPDGGRAEPRIRSMIAEFGLEETGEANAPWSLRLHDRSMMTYDVQLLAMRKSAI